MLQWLVVLLRMALHRSILSGLSTPQKISDVYA